jgi:subtilisin family serine protease
MPDPRPHAITPRADHGRVRVALTLSLLLLAALAPAAQAASGETRIIVGRDPGLSSGERAAIRHDAGVVHVENLRLDNAELVQTDDPRAALAALRRSPDVQYAQIDHLRHAFTSDPIFKYQWALDNTGTNLSADLGYPPGTPDADMDVVEAWSQSTGSGAPPVAIVDTGAQPDHPDLIHQISPLSRSFIGASYADGNGHGTHVAGIVAAERDNNQDGSGVAPDATVMVLKALDDAGGGYDSDIADAFDYAADHGAKVVNASLGGPSPGPYLETAIARHPDVLFVFAAGNGGADDVGAGTDNDAPAPSNGDGGPMYPCNFTEANIICVGASTDTDGVASFSNYGATSVDLFAPGRRIASSIPGSTWGLMSGTSMASPMVAGEAALVLAAAPSLNATQVKAAILGSVDPKAAFTAFSVTGGRANAQAAVASIAPVNPPDADGDGVPNAADRTPRGPDADGDGVPALDDACPTVAASTANGCPAPVVAPASTQSPGPAPGPTAGDADGDGRPDNYDLCPSEPAATTTGCPVPSLRSLTVKVVRAKHRATVRVRTSRTATVAITVERRVCNARGRQCKWRRAYTASKVSHANAASFTTRRLARGSYRVTAKVSSPAGRAAPVRKPFRA